MALADHNCPPDAPNTRSEIPKRPNWHPRLAAFWYAAEGIWHLLRTQRNAQIHCAVAGIIIVLGFALGIDLPEWLVIVVMITLVLAAEGVNTAIEAVVDLVAPEYHPLAKVAKDVGAGTVLLVAIGSVVVGVLIFLPRLWALVAPLLGV